MEELIKGENLREFRRTIEIVELNMLSSRERIAMEDSWSFQNTVEEGGVYSLSSRRVEKEVGEEIVFHR